MLRKAIVFTILTFLITGCVTGPDDYFKRSANNKIFDRKGFKESKRQPLYNKKYIAQAKKNILNGEYDDEELDDEAEDISRENIEMYKAMIEEDLNSTKQNRRGARGNNRSRANSAYPSIVAANDKLTPDTHDANLELKEEIAQIKSMLNEAKKDLASYKCPTARDLEEENIKPQTKAAPKKQQTQKPKAQTPEAKPSQETRNIPEHDNATSHIPDDSSNTMIIEPVQSI